MYCLSDKQIDYILNDIGARGVEMESLQLNLHDHVCCIIEQNLEANGDFESFYKKTIKTFYKDELWEIEEETLLLLTYKNYYTMKKIMIMSGIIAASTMILGMILKFMQWPGSAPFIILGIGTSSLIFLPLLFILKVKDRQQTKDKIILALGILSGILLSLSILFRVMHWPGSMFIGYAAICITGLLLLPLYFITGIKNPDNKINTITISIILIMVCGLWLTLIRSPKATVSNNIKNTQFAWVNETIIATEKQLDKLGKDSLESAYSAVGKKVISNCDELKAIIIFNETGQKSIKADFELSNSLISDTRCSFNESNLTNEFLKNVKLYNAKIDVNTHQYKIPEKNNIIEYLNSYMQGSNIEVLQQLTQIQMIVLQNERL